MAEVKKVKRTEFAAFLNVGTATQPKYARMGKGITGQVLAYNPKLTEVQFIDGNNGTAELEGYAPSLPTPQNAYRGDEVFDYVDGLRKERATGDAAKTDVLLVYVYEKEGENSFAAEKNDVVIVVNDFGGEAGAPVTINYDLKFTGEPVKGTATIANKVATFATATAE